MEKVDTTSLDEFVKLAGDFVTKQKGRWDHKAWLDFLASLQKQGLDYSDDVQKYVGQVLEAMKRFYQASASIQGIEKALAEVARDSLQFIKENQAVWSHSDWEAFVSRVQKNTVILSEETTAYLGGILESVKTFYNISPNSGYHPVRLAIVSLEKPVENSSTDVQDDLTAIIGIGPALRKKLNEQGIFRFSQIAELSEEDIERLEENIIKFSGRIKRDDWIGQARRFTEEMR